MVVARSGERVLERVFENNEVEAELLSMLVILIHLDLDEASAHRRFQPPVILSRPLKIGYLCGPRDH